MDDFSELTVETVHRKERRKSRFRDHGHEAAVCRSYQMVRPGGGASSAATRSYVWETGELFLATKEALDRNSTICIRSFQDQFSQSAGA
jgi:hypothetical protein